MPYIIILAVIAIAAYWWFSLRARFMLSKANELYAKGEHDTALSLVKKANDIRFNPDIAVYYGFVLIKDGQFDAASAVLNSIHGAKVTKSHKMRIKINLAIVAWKTGDILEAIESMEEVFASYKTSHVYGCLGLVYIEHGDLSRALDFCTQAYEFNGDDNVILDNLADVYIKKGDFERARPLCEKLVSKNPRFPEAYYHMGLVQQHFGEHDAARSSFLSALGKNFTAISVVTREEIEAAIAAL